MTITGFGINASVNGEDTSVTVYEDVGAVNAVTSGSGIWTQIASGGVFSSSGNNIPTELPVALNVPIASGNTDTFLIMVSGNSFLHYTVGGSVGDVMASNADLNILPGWGEGPDFTAFDPREANVSVDYTVSLVPEPASLAIFGLGMTGLGLVRQRPGKSNISNKLQLDRSPS
jgi:hypothetical protein